MPALAWFYLQGRGAMPASNTAVLEVDATNRWGCRCKVFVFVIVFVFIVVIVCAFLWSLWLTFFVVGGVDGFKVGCTTATLLLMVLMLL